MSRQAGVTLIEVMITLMVLTVGLLGLAGVIGKTTSAAIDANQRARAVVMLQDINERVINTRRGDWSTAASAGEYGASVVQACAAATTALGQACRWGNLLAGQADGGTGSMPMRGCLERIGTGSAEFLATVAWTSTSAGVTPPTSVTCGESLVSAAKTNQRRFATLVVRLPVLSSSGLGTVSETP